MTADREITQRERDFHNERFGAEIDPRIGLGKWYETISHGAVYQGELVLNASRGRDVLEYGCADGGLSLNSLKLHETAATVTGIDISDVAIDKANRRAQALRADNAHFLAMDAQNMAFPSSSFDVVFGRGIIHHLELSTCFSEIRRILRPGGAAYFFEPMGHNPVLNAFRRKTPNLRTPDEHPLVKNDFRLAQTFFSKVDVRFYGLATVPSGLIPRAIRPPFYWISRGIDAIVLRVPGLRYQAWYASIVLKA